MRPADDQVGVGRPDSETLNPPRGLAGAVRLEPVRSRRDAWAISQVESPSHPVSVTIADRTATVALSQRDAALDRDFVLTVEAAGLDTPQAWSNGTRTTILTRSPLPFHRRSG